MRRAPDACNHSLAAAATDRKAPERLACACCCCGPFAADEGAFFGHHLISCFGGFVLVLVFVFVAFYFILFSPIWYWFSCSPTVCISGFELEILGNFGHG